MKYVIYLICFILCYHLGQAQNKERLSRAYIGVQVHEDQPGFTLTNSFGINKYLGVGAGVDITSYEKEILGPVYLDVRGRLPVNKWEPFILGQFGKNLYKKQDAATAVDITGQGFRYDKNGKLFYGFGLGTTYNIGKVGVFASYTFRGYKYKYSAQKNNSAPSFPDVTVNANIISAGLVF